MTDDDALDGSEVLPLERTVDKDMRTAKLTFTFSKTKRLCGTHDNPGGDPVRLVAR